ncbi:MAG TPA: hypothetical protein VE546_06300 [Streptomyces sp.]|uniref:hypothetical protein n=1 Tax=Streptomyces sp. TaxID=1931 RepID=UPI002D60F2AE|nr:hypothetical protein [Streptomyces sp.]HZG03165.1 hypothetical protein [Streptomyces sp.]
MGLNEANGANGASREATTVRVDIGELVLDGFDARIDPEQVADAFRNELTRLVRERGVPLAADGGGRELEALSGLPPLPATLSPARLGEALARAVHAGLSGRGDPGAAAGRRRR